MRRIETFAFARAGLVGNPSDGYFGRTLSLIVRNFRARVVVYEWPTLEILPSEGDHVRFDSLDDLAADVAANGYYGGLRLVKASLKKFHDYCSANNVKIPRHNFSIRYETNIPRGVGLAGSSAIITATFRALMAWHNVQIPQNELPNWVLATERDELRIQAGLQDRVAQTFEGLTYMDFSREKMARDGFGLYESLDPNLLPPLYLAYQAELAEVSDVVHNNLRERWDNGDAQVHAAMLEFAELTKSARECLLNGEKEKLGEFVDANFEVRRKIMNLNPGHVQMVETARKCGASAHFAGSGGAIVGTCNTLQTFETLQNELTKLGCRVIVPKIV